MEKTTTANRLRFIMEKRHLRQVDILEAATPYCKKYGVKMGRNALSQYVSGKVEPRQDKLSVLGLALDVSEAWLMGFDVPMERNNSDMDFKERLEYAMKKAGLSHIEVAEKMHLALSDIDSFCNGERYPDPDIVSSLSWVIGVNSSWLLGDYGIKMTDEEKTKQYPIHFYRHYEGLIIAYEQAPELTQRNVCKLLDCDYVKLLNEPDEDNVGSNDGKLEPKK